MKRAWISLILAFLVACQPVIPAPIVRSAETPFSTSTPLALSTAAPTSTPFFDTTISYELRQPKADELLSLIDILLAKENDGSFLYNDSLSIGEWEGTSLHRLIGSDFINYYADGFPNAEIFVTETVSPWKIFWLGDLNSISPVLRISLLQYINNHQDVLENDSAFSLPRSKIEIYSMDLDGDGLKEWLIGAEYAELNLQNWLLLKKQADGLYHQLEDGSFFNYSGIQDFSNDVQINDLTGEGNPEIVHAFHYYLAGTMHTIVTVYTWDDKGLSVFDSIYLPNVPPRYGELYESEYVLGDFNNDGVDDIRVDTPRFGRFDCQWTETNYYRFVDQEMKNEKVGSEIPETNECLLTRALVSTIPSEQIKLYRSAIENIDLKGSTTDKLAWARVHLAMAYAANGDDQKAISQLEMLQTMNGDGKFLEFVRNIYDTDHASPLAFCDALYAATYQRFLDRIGSDIDSELTHDLYPIDYAPVSNLVCPFPETVLARLEGIKIPISDSPIDVLTQNGLPFAWSEPINWDNDPLQEWIGVLQFSKPIIVLLDGDTFWQPVVIDSHSMNASGLDAVIYSPSDQISPELLVLFTTESRYCDSPETEKNLVAIDPNIFEYDVQAKCDSISYSLASRENIELAITEFSKANRFGPEIDPDWYYLTDKEDVDGYQNDIMDFVRALEDLIISRRDPIKAVSKLDTIASALPPDDPSAKLLLNRLYYLRGLNYELGGQGELAVKTYLKLIEISPESIWSQYAKLRLQPAH
jgi:tetratricopeptide (TPR) repeat protein